MSENTRTRRVVRERLLGRLARRHSRRAIVVVAGAGFGKTTVLRQAMADLAGHVEPAGAVDVFVPVRADVTMTDGTIVRAVGRELTGDAEWVGGVDDLIGAIWTRSPQQVCVLLDDVHHLDDAAAHDVAALLDALPNNGHLVLSGRRRPIDIRSRWLLDDSVDVIEESDLAFDDDELAALERLRGLAPGTAAGRRWPALLELELVAGRTGVVHYLLDEVVAELAPERAAIARRLAVAPYLDAELVDVISGGTESPTSIAELLPMSQLTPDRSSVALHDLVRDVLLDGFEPAARAESEREVARALRARGDLHGAIGLLAAARATDELDDIAREMASDLYVRSATASNRVVLATLRSVLGPNLVLDVLDAVLTLIDRPGDATEMLESVATRCRDAGDTPLETLCVLRLADDAYTASDLERLGVAAARLRELAAAGVAAASRVEFIADIWERSSRGRHRELVAGLEQTGLLDDDTTDRDLRDFARFNHIIHRAYSGHVREALVDAEVLRRLPDGLYANRLAGFELVQRWHLGELTEADREFAVRLVDRIESMGQWHLFVEGAATTALFHASAGDITTARRLTERADHERRRLPATAWPHHTVAQAISVMQLLDGDEDAAAATLRAAMPAGGPTDLPRFVYGATASLSYVLVDEARAMWEADECGPDHRVRLDIGRALVALRLAGDTAPAAELPWGDAETIRTWAFEPHLIELALAAIEADRVSPARSVLDDLRGDPRRTLDRLETDGPDVIRPIASRTLEAMPVRPVQVLSVAALGPLELRRGGVPVRDELWIRRQRVRDLLGLLVDRRRVDRTELAALMWPDKSPKAASSNLRFTLNQLQAVLEPDRAEAATGWFVRTVGTELHLAGGDRLQIDVDEFRRRLADARFEDGAGSPGRALEHLLAAVEWYRGRYLTGVSDEEWGSMTALHLQGQFVDAVARAVDLLIAAGEPVEAERIAMLAVAAEPINETAIVALARALLARGRVGVARERLAALLDDLDLVGLSPEPATIAIADRLGFDRHAHAGSLGHLGNHRPIADVKPA